MANIIKTPTISPLGSIYKGSDGVVDDYIYTPLGSIIIGSYGNDYIDGAFSPVNIHATPAFTDSSLDYAQLLLPKTGAFTLNANLSTGTGTLAVSPGVYSQSLKNIDNIFGLVTGTNTLTGNKNNNIFGAGIGNDTIIGNGGFDTVDYNYKDLAKTGVTVNLATGSASGGGGTDKLTGISEVVGTKYSDILTGSAGNNAFITNGGGDVVNGGTGIDTCIYGDLRSTYKIGVAVNGQFYVGTAQNPTKNLDLLTNIERLQFNDCNLAFDFDSASGSLTGNLGIVEKVLYATFGQTQATDPVTSPKFIGIGLNALDTGTSYSALMKIALDYVKSTSNLNDYTALDLLWTNIIGTSPTKQQMDPFYNSFKNGTALEQIAIQAADSIFNTAKIELNIIGVRQSGLTYTPVSSEFFQCIPDVIDPYL
jgi:hypothetical protein